jgi:hypothetical protein
MSSGVLEMPKGTIKTKGTVKIGPAIDAKLYKEFVAVAEENGQSQRYLLEKAIEHYLHNVVPSLHLVRPEVLEAYRRSNEKFRALYQKLAK